MDDGIASFKGERCSLKRTGESGGCGRVIDMQKSVSHLLQASSSPALVPSKKCTRIAYTFNHMHPSGNPNERRAPILCHLICKHAAHRGSDAMHDNVDSLPPPKKKRRSSFDPPSTSSFSMAYLRRNLLTHDQIVGSSSAYIFMLLNNEWKGTEKSLSSSLCRFYA